MSEAEDLAWCFSHYIDVEEWLAFDLTPEQIERLCKEEEEKKDDSSN